MIYKESNLKLEGQNLTCCHYTIDQYFKQWWSLWTDSNPQPTVYKTVALPLCYTGKLELPERIELSFPHYKSGALPLDEGSIETI